MRDARVKARTYRKKARKASRFLSGRGRGMGERERRNRREYRGRWHW